MIEGIAELPLHDGRVPPWLLTYMKRLGRAIALYIVREYGASELVKRLADPFWFQAFNNVIGMDWDSSGSTTVVLYVLKSFANVETFKEVGFAILGGKGTDAKRVPEELKSLEKHDLDIDKLEYISRISAKIDSVALQDGYDLYIHGLIVSEDGSWTVIQQGMNLEIKMARRYHIHSNTIPSAEADPHSGIACNRVDVALNMIDRDSRRARKTIVELVNASPPSTILREIAEVNRLFKGVKDLSIWMNKSIISRSGSPKREVEALKKLNPRFYRPITSIDRIERVLRKLHSYKPTSFEELLLFRGVGPEFIRALALVADIIYSERPSFKDPVTHFIDPFLYAYAHGGKDGIPFPVRRDVLQHTVEFLEQAIEGARLEDNYRKQALKRLAVFAKQVLSATG